MGVFDRVRQWMQSDQPAQAPSADSPAMGSDPALSSPTASSISVPKPSWVILWRDAILSYTPVFMLIVGALLTALSELIAGWAFLGYLLLALSPVVYWLIRIERHLADLVQIQRKK